MLRRSTRTSHIALIAFAAIAAFAAPSATAATPTQIHTDAADGSIDSTYTAEELRAADRTVSASQREYLGWEDVYRAALRGLADPDSEEALVVVPIDSNRNGKIDKKEKEVAEKRTRAKRVARGLDPTPDSADDGDGDGDGETTSASGDESDDDGGSPLIWLIIGIPLLIVAFGAWRMRRAGAGRKRGGGTGTGIRGLRRGRRAPKGNEFP